MSFTMTKGGRAYVVASLKGDFFMKKLKKTILITKLIANSVSCLYWVVRVVLLMLEL